MLMSLLAFVASMIQLSQFEGHVTAVQQMSKPLMIKVHKHTEQRSSHLYIKVQHIVRVQIEKTLGNIHCGM